MSYQVLARKWRPRLFQDMVGQQHVLKVLTNALNNDRLHHAYLFTGTRGVGKTTLARIFAKCLNCEKGVSSNPCGECSACVSIDEGRFLDLIEVDAASRAKVDETRELMDNVQYSPSVGRYKVYLIDEVQMFSNHSFNALLKTLEEPPPHVKFLLATTEAKKIPVTILSRCLQFNLKRLSVDQIQEQLSRILEKENVESDDVSKRLVAVAADGSLRDALSLLDQAIAHGGGSLQEDQVRSMLGTIDSLELNKLLESLIEGDAEKVLAHADNMAEHSPDYDAVLVELLSLLQEIAVCNLLEDNAENKSSNMQISKLAKMISSEDIQLYYQMGLVGRRDLPLAPDPRIGFEMTLIRMLAFRPASQVIRDKITEMTPGVPVITNDAVNNEDFSEAQQQAQTGKSEIDSNGITKSNDWQTIIDEMALAGLVKELAGHCVLKEHTDEKIYLVLTPAQEHLLKTTQKERLSTALKAHFGKDIAIKITVETPGAETPTQRKEREKREEQSAAEKSVQEDPVVKAMQETFGATVDEDSIRPNTN